MHRVSDGRAERARSVKAAERKGEVVEPVEQEAVGYARLGERRGKWRGEQPRDGRGGEEAAQAVQRDRDKRTRVVTQRERRDAARGRGDGRAKGLQLGPIRERAWPAKLAQRALPVVGAARAKIEAPAARQEHLPAVVPHPLHVLADGVEHLPERVGARLRHAVV